MRNDMGNPQLAPAWVLGCWLWEDAVHTSDDVDESLIGPNDFYK